MVSTSDRPKRLDSLIQAVQSYVVSSEVEANSFGLPKDLLEASELLLPSRDLDQLINLCYQSNSFQRLLALLVLRYERNDNVSTAEKLEELAQIASVCNCTGLCEFYSGRKLDLFGSPSLWLARRYFQDRKFLRAVDIFRECQAFEDLSANDLFTCVLALVRLGYFQDAKTLITSLTEETLESNELVVSNAIQLLLSFYLPEQASSPSIDYEQLKAVLVHASHKLLVHIAPILVNLENLCLSPPADDPSDLVRINQFYWKRLSSYHPLVSNFEPIKQLVSLSALHQLRIALVFDDSKGAGPYCRALDRWLQQAVDIKAVSVTVVILEEQTPCCTPPCIATLSLAGLSQQELISTMRDQQFSAIVDYTEALDGVFLFGLLYRLAPLQLRASPPISTLALSPAYDAYITDRWSDLSSLGVPVSCVQLSGVSMLADSESQQACPIISADNSSNNQFIIRVHGERHVLSSDIKRLVRILRERNIQVFYQVDDSSLLADIGISDDQAVLSHNDPEPSAPSIVLFSWQYPVPSSIILRWTEASIPVVVCSRSAALNNPARSIMACLGLEVLVSDDIDDAADTIQELYSDQATLDQLRSSLPILLKQSLLSNEKIFFDDLFDGIRQLISSSLSASS